MRHRTDVGERLIAAVTGLALATIVAAIGCSRGAPPETPTTTPAGPDIQAIPDKEITIQAHAVGAERYEWRLDGPGHLLRTTGAVVDYVRRSGEAGRATLLVTAHNAHGASAPAELSIRLADISAVRLDAVAVPAGWMAGLGRPETVLSWSPGRDGCRDGAGTNRPGCMRARYRAGGQWGGIFWWPRSCGDSGNDEAWLRARAGTCAVDLREVGGLREVNRVVFWARGDAGGEGVEFRVGSQDMAPIPGLSTGTQQLKRTWTQIEIDLRRVDMTKAIGLFAWIVTDASNPQGAQFYLDGIQFEGVR